jgi:integrase
LARELAREALVKLARGGDPVAAKREAAAKAKGGKVPFADALKRHLAALSERGRSPAHRGELERVVKAAIAAGLKDLATPSIASKAATWLDGLDISDQTKHRYRVHLIAVGKTAVRWWPADVLPREPFLALSGKGAPMPVPPYFTPPECVALASDAAVARVEDGGPLWAFLLYTGCRYREAAFARWDRIDLGHSTFSVLPPSAQERESGEAVKRNKSRTVSLQAEIVQLLRDWRKTDPKGAFVFDEMWRTKNHRWNVEAFRRHLAALAIPLDGRRIHSLRHSHACLAIASGEDSLRLRLSMGHAGEQMQAHYASAAMRWRGLLHEWRGTWKLRDAADVARLTKAPAGKAVAS